jgi:hypothetical protein
VTRRRRKGIWQSEKCFHLFIIREIGEKNCPLMENIRKNVQAKFGVYFNTLSNHIIVIFPFNRTKVQLSREYGFSQLSAIFLLFCHKKPKMFLKSEKKSLWAYFLDQRLLLKESSTVCFTDLD